MSNVALTVPPVDLKRLRAALAAAQITHSAFARTAGLNRVYLGGILSGRIKPGELAVIRIGHGLEKLGLDCEADHD